MSGNNTGVGDGAATEGWSRFGPMLLRQLGTLVARRHFEREVEARQVLARMVVREGELRDAEIVRPRLGAFVDAGVEIDVVHAGRTGCPHDDLDIALAVEG